MAAVSTNQSALRYKSSGREVAQLQADANTYLASYGISVKGVDPKQGLPTDGKYGLLTRDVVTAIQRDLNLHLEKKDRLQLDGIYGRRTRDALTQANAATSQLPALPPPKSTPGVSGVSTAAKNAPPQLPPPQQPPVEGDTLPQAAPVTSQPTASAAPASVSVLSTPEQVVEWGSNSKKNPITPQAARAQFIKAAFKATTVKQINAGLRDGADDLAKKLVDGSKSLPTPQRAAIQTALASAIRDNALLGDKASRTISIEVNDGTDRSVITYDLQNQNMKSSGVRFSSTDAVDKLMQQTDSPEAAHQYAQQIIDNIVESRRVSKLSALQDSQKRAIASGVYAWLNDAHIQGRPPANPVFRIIDDNQAVTSQTRAININMERGQEQLVWMPNAKQPVAANGLTSSTKNGTAGGYVNRYSNVNDANTFELGLFNTTMYYGKHGRVALWDGVNGDFTNAGTTRYLETHEASYVVFGGPGKSSTSGQSWGCDAVDKREAGSIVEYIAEGQTFRYSERGDGKNNTPYSKSSGAEKLPNGGKRTLQSYNGAFWVANEVLINGWGELPNNAAPRPAPTDKAPILEPDPNAFIALQ